MKRIVPSHLVLLAIVAIVFAWSAWKPHDRLTWWLETMPAIVGAIVLCLTYTRFRFTTLVYTVIAIHMCILCIGGHYTYARVPFFDWLRPLFDWERNHFDRLGHFAQGFVPALIARELFIRLEILNRTRWLPFLTICVCLAISAFYEMIEWWAAALSKSAAVEFLATQGDVWDTQKDMLLALFGAICALFFLAPWHRHALDRVAPHDR